LNADLPVTILDICEQLDRLDDDGVIYAGRINGNFTPASQALVVTLAPEEVRTPAADIAAPHGPRFDYCMEIFIAKDAVEVWSRWRDGARPTPTERAEAVCYKANNDAWGPPNFPV
jgi:hypothetical protein